MVMMRVVVLVVMVMVIVMIMMMIMMLLLAIIDWAARPAIRSILLARARVRNGSLVRSTSHCSSPSPPTSTSD